MCPKFAQNQICVKINLKKKERKKRVAYLNKDRIIKQR